MAAPVITHTMAASLFTQPSASKEELQHACSFIQSECNRHQRPYDMLAVVCGGLRPLYSGSSIEAELIASISALLSPTSSQDGTWNRLPSARYDPIAQEALFKCGGLDPIVAALSYPSAANKPAISRCAATSTARICSLIYIVQVHCARSRTATYPHFSCCGIRRSFLSRRRALQHIEERHHSQQLCQVCFSLNSFSHQIIIRT